MALEGLHHITAITGDAPANVGTYSRLLGLRMVKKTVNFDQPDVYRLYYADEMGTPGWALTFFEYPGATPRASDTSCWRSRSATRRSCSRRSGSRVTTRRGSPGASSATPC
jgi:catechol 2,3-dioxygenase-like lactoylglutathione lyase family enzyme